MTQDLNNYLAEIYKDVEKGSPRTLNHYTSKAIVFLLVFKVDPNYFSEQLSASFNEVDYMKEFIKFSLNFLND